MRCVFAPVVLGMVASCAAGDLLTVKSYDMTNGETGAASYFDNIYSGAGDHNVAGAALSGGLGLLTDDAFPVGPALLNPAQWVGWNTITPTITFHFDGVVTLDQVNLVLDGANSDGKPVAPTFIHLKMGGNTIDLPIQGVDPNGPFIMGVQTPGLSGDSLEMTIEHKDGWMFLAEASFLGVPTPGALAAFGFAGLGLSRRRR